jgi:hypothetical protein
MNGSDQGMLMKSIIVTELESLAKLHGIPLIFDRNSYSDDVLLFIESFTIFKRHEPQILGILESILVGGIEVG